MPMMKPTFDLVPRGGRGRRIARAAGRLGRVVVVAFVAAGLATFVAAPMLVGTGGPPGVAEPAPATRAPSARPPADAAQPGAP